MESQSAAKSPSPSPSPGGVAQDRQFSAASSSKLSGFFGEHLRSEMSRKHEEENFLDSGYGSQDSSQAATPDRLAVNESGSDPKERAIELRLSKTKTLLAFNDEIDELYTIRFYSIQPTIESLLLQYIKRKSFLRGTGRHKPMAIRLLFLGNSELDARPHIVVFCAPEMRKRVQHFFDKDDLVKAFYKPDDASLPSFDVAVCECAPQLRNGETVVEVFRDATANAELAKSFNLNTPFEDTLCGTPIRLQANGKTRNATLGGLLKLEYDTGETELLGLTAGHAARACLEGWANQDALDDDLSADDNASTVSSFVDSESDCSQSDSDETPMEDPDSQSSKNQAVGEHNDAQSWAFKYPTAFGDIRSQGDGTQTGSQVSEGSFDWALINLKDFKPNRLPSFMFRGQSDAWKTGITKYRNQSPSMAGALSENRVILMCGSSSPKYGYLASQPARILIDLSDVFVDAFMVVLDAGDEVVDGDSGAWVVMEDTHEVVGHIVATDPLGAGYIIPLCDIFSDIQRSLGVARVSLPSVRDIEDTQLKNALNELAAVTGEDSSVLTKMLHDDSSRKLEDRHEKKHPESPYEISYTYTPPSTAHIPATTAVPHSRASKIYVQAPSNAREPRSYSEDKLYGIVAPTPTIHVPTEALRPQNRRRRSGIYINGQRVDESSTSGKASHISSSKSRSPHRKERIVIVDGPPRPRQPPQVHYSGSDSYSHDSGYSSNGSSSRNSPNWGMTPASSADDPIYRDTKVIDRGSTNRRPAIGADRIADRLNRISDQMAEGWQQRHTIVRIPENEEREEIEMSFRREAMRAKIAAANMEIASIPIAPIVPLDGSLDEVGRADAEQQLVESVKQLNLASGRRQAPDAGRAEATRRSRRDKVGQNDNEEEAQKQRLMDRMTPRRRATAELGSRRRPEYDNRDVYRWE